MDTVKFKISGMHCASCSSLTTRELNSLGFVKEASVNLATTEALVEYDGSKGTVEELFEAVKNAGFTPEFVDDEESASKKKVN